MRKRPQGHWQREREGKKQSKDTAEERGTERNPEKEESADFSTRG